MSIWKHKALAFATMLSFLQICLLFHSQAVVPQRTNKQTENFFTVQLLSPSNNNCYYYQILSRYLNQNMTQQTGVLVQSMPVAHSENLPQR